ncbi:hypothetical protein J4E85_001243 [Alternaria conjuncta]|uniref:uncharacterized protein n=1 Tax=Alternaria conjuncta TaxID=181017 RepID=UPI0022208D2A|nr:uncharacterized protein J4E85_001243 [Alternaria conjuncta]KAI4935916.1 hypothetical protein J4E85_001243 [Alternaria conjuncta]
MKGLLVLLEPRTLTAEMPTVPLSLAPQDIPEAQQAWKDFLGLPDHAIFSNFQLKTSLLEQADHSQQDRSSVMALTRGSLTSFKGPVDEGSAIERNHLSHDELDKAHQPTSHPPKFALPSISTTKAVSTQGLRSLRQLAGYATSEEDEPAGLPILLIKKGQRKKPAAYKSAETAASDSSESRSSRPRSRQVLSSPTLVAKRKQLQTSTSRRQHKRVMGTVNHKRSDSKVGKTKNMTAKRRPSEPFASSSTAKRPCTKGGFVVTSSDESDIEGSDESDQDDRKHGSLSRSPVPRPSWGLEKPDSFPASLRVESTSTNLPTKQLNKDRLNALLGRFKGTKTNTKEKRLAMDAQQSVATVRASAVAPGLTAPLNPQPSAPVQSTGSSDTNRGKRSAAVSETKPAESLDQQPKVRGPSMSTTEGKPTSIFQETAQPIANIRTYGSVQKQISSNPLPPSAAIEGSSPSAAIQPRKLLDASTLPGHENDASSHKVSPATKPMSLLQLALMDARNDGTGKPSSKARTSGRNELEIAKRSPILTSPVSKFRKTAQLPGNDRNTATNNASPEKHSLSPGDVLKVSRPEAAKRSQDQAQPSASKSRRSTPSVSKADTADSKSASSAPGQPAQKRKLDIISDESGQITGTASKRPTLTYTTGSKRPDSAMPASEDGITPGSVVAPRTYSREVPTKASEVPPSTAKKGDTSHGAASTPRIEKSSNDSMIQMSGGSKKSREASTLMDVDSLDHTTTGISSVSKTTDVKPVDEHVAIVKKGNNLPMKDLNTTSSAKTIDSATKTATTPPVSTTDPGLLPLETTIDTNEEILHLNGLPGVSNEAQPYFEYSVFQKTWQGEQVESTLPATEITVRPFTSLDDANAQAEKVFQSNATLFNDVIFEKSNNRDEYGCSILTGSITPFDNPANTSHLKIWVQRDLVSALANQTPQAIKGTSFISSTCYIVRLFKLITQADAEDSSSSSSSSSDAGTDSPDPSTQEPIRAYHAHTRPEIYTTLSAANRAARALQIQLSHEKEPKDALSKAFQEKNLQELNTKVVQLQSTLDEEGGCWKSRFNACGLGGDSLELVVEKTSLCGPRNL